jgi:hypothetical protein
MRVAASILLLALLLCGCGSGEPTDAASSGVELTYHRSGGLPGVDETLRIHRSGSATLDAVLYPVGEGKRRTIRFRLSAAQAERLRPALEESGFDDLAPDSRGVTCADCLIYELATAANQVRFDQRTVPEELKPVLEQLDAIVAAHRPGQTPNL